MWKQFSVLREKEKGNFADERRERSIDSSFKIKLAIQIRCCCNLAVIVRPILLRERSAGWFSNFVRRIWARFPVVFILSLHFIDGWKEERAHSFNLMALSLCWLIALRTKRLKTKQSKKKRIRSNIIILIISRRIKSQLMATKKPQQTDDAFRRRSHKMHFPVLFSHSLSQLSYYRY